MKEEINKDMETLKEKSIQNKQFIMTNVYLHWKRVSGTENKVEEIDQTVKDHERMLKKNIYIYIYTIGTSKISGTPWKKTNLWIIGVEEGEKTQTKGIDNLFSRTIAENFPNLESHPGAGSLHNSKPSGPKRKPPDTT
jgi:hypothetical protein